VGLLRLRCVAAPAAACAALCAVPVAAASVPGTLADLRVCPYEAFSKLRGACTRDAGPGPIVSTHLYCSVTVLASRRGTVRGVLAYRGKPIASFAEAVPPGRWRYWLVNDLATPLPGGAWTCSYTFGPAHVVRSFRSGGPTGAVVGAAVCTSAHAVRVSSVRMCASDESGTALAASSDLVCSVVVPDAKGERLRIELLSGGQDVQAPWTATLPGPVWQEAGYFAGPFAPGDYVCRITLAGRVVAERPFRISE